MTDIDLNDYVEQLGDPSDYFVDIEGRERPLVVRHADGVPVFVVGSAGTLMPCEAPESSGEQVEASLDFPADEAEFSRAPTSGVSHGC